MIPGPLLINKSHPFPSSWLIRASVETVVNVDCRLLELGREGRCPDPNDPESAILSAVQLWLWATAQALESVCVNLCPSSDCVALCPWTGHLLFLGPGFLSTDNLGALWKHH